MSEVNLFVVFAISWWLILFIVLPFGVRSHHEEGGEHEKGIEKAAPIRPNIVKKMKITTVFAVLVTLIFWAVAESGLISIY